MPCEQNQPIVEVRNVSFRYPGGVQALTDVSLSICPGEVVAVLGSNGSGKTTLVKHFNGLNRPTSGTVLVNGRDIRNVPIARVSETVGYVFQNPSHQIFLSTAREELYYGLGNLGVPKEEADRRVKNAVELFDLENLLDVNPFDLNSSERKTIAMAAVMAIAPRMIVLDEPTTGQDYAGICRISELIRRMHEQGHTVVIITHDMNIVGQLACRVVLMKNSRLIADDTAENVFRNPAVLHEAKIEPPQITVFTEGLPWMSKDRSFLTVSATADWFAEYLG